MCRAFAGSDGVLWIIMHGWNMDICMIFQLSCGMKCAWIGDNE